MTEKSILFCGPPGKISSSFLLEHCTSVFCMIQKSCSIFMMEHFRRSVEVILEALRFFITFKATLHHHKKSIFLFIVCIIIHF